MLDGITIPLNVVDNPFDVEFDVEEVHNKVSPSLGSQLLCFLLGSQLLEFDHHF